MFWSLVLHPGKKYSSTVKESFHLSMAVLDTKSVGKNDTGVFPVQVVVDDEELILCNLSNSCLQASLDLMFEKGAKLTFLTSGKAIIHLTGYLMREDYDESDMSNDSDDSSETEAVEDNISFADKKTKSKEIKRLISGKDSPEKRKADLSNAVREKKAKLGEDSSGDDEDSDDEELGDSDLDNFSFSENDDDENEIDEDDSDSPATTDSDDDVSPFDDSPNKKKNVLATPKSDKKIPVRDEKQNKTPVSNKKQTDKQNKTDTPSQVANGVTPKFEKKKKNKSPKPDVKTPKGNESSPGASNSVKKQTLEGGVIIEELKQGNGPIAKPGKMVAVYYTGRLKNNNRVFDQSNSGNGFKFRVGRGEVIKGWDVAVSGMKVGSKRRITCPPAMAYGAKGSPPSIPPNSSLVFDVELRSVVN